MILRNFEVRWTHKARKEYEKLSEGTESKMKNLSKIFIVLLIFFWIFNGGPQTEINKAYAANETGMVMWGTGTTVTPKYKNWNGTAFDASASNAATANATIQYVVLKEAPTRVEFSQCTLASDGDLNCQIFSGGAWGYGTGAPADGNYQNFGTTNDAYRGYDIAYEQSSGKLLLVYDDGTTANQTVWYRTWDGTSWSAATSLSIPTGTNNTSNWIKLEPKPGSDEIMLAVLDSNSDIYAMRWTGSGWSNGQLLTAAASVAFSDPFDIAWEGLSGDAMVAFGTGTVTDFWTFSGGIWTDGSGSISPAAVVHQLELAAASGNNYIAMIMIDAGADVNVHQWNGSSWISTISEDAAAELFSTTIRSHEVDVAWESAGNRFMYAYVDSAAVGVDYFFYDLDAPGWFAGDGTTAITVVTGATLGPENFDDDVEVFHLDVNPSDPAQIMQTGAGLTNTAASNLWNGSTWTTYADHGTTTAGVSVDGYDAISFAWNRPPAATATVSLADTSISFAQGTKEDLIKIVVSCAGVDIEIKSFSFTFKDAGGADLPGKNGTDDLDDLASNLFVYLDNPVSNDGVYVEADDAASVASLAAASFLTSATQTLDTENGNANIILGVGVSKTYFLVVQLTAGATSATKKAFYVIFNLATDSTKMVIKSPPTTEANTIIPTTSDLTTKVAKAAYFRNYIGSASSLTTPHIRKHPNGTTRAYFGTSTGELYCYDVADGVSPWAAYDTGTNALSPPFGYDDGTNVRLYFGVGGTPGASNFYALVDKGTSVSDLQADTGWATNPINLGGHGAAVSAIPTIRVLTCDSTDYYNIYIGCTDSAGPHLHCIKATSGGDCGTTLCGTYTVNSLATGSAISSFSRAGTSYNYINSGTKLCRVNSTDGGNLTSRDFSPNIVSGSPYPVSASEMFVGEGATLHKVNGECAGLTDYGAGCCVEACQTSWANFTTPEGGNIGNSPFATKFYPENVNGKVFIATSSGVNTGKLFAVNATTGAEIWRYPAAASFIGEIRTQPMYVRTSATDSALNYVVVSSDDGYIYFIKVSDGSLIDRGYLGATATQNCTPIQVPNQSKVIVGSTNGYIFCFPVP